MGDPLSIAAGVAGILTAAGQISSLLIDFIKNTDSAPQDARNVLADVSETSVILSSLQSLILGTDVADRSRTSLLQVDHVIVIVTGCVSTFSELESLLDGLKLEQMGLLDRFKWISEAPRIAGILERLEAHKISLTLMLTILNGSNMEVVLRSIEGIRQAVNEKHADILTKLERMEQYQTCHQSNLSSVLVEGIEDNASTDTIEARPHEGIESTQLLRFTFDTELLGSRVYRNVPYGSCTVSLYTRSAHTTSWSVLSGLSMADVSQVSVLNLAIGLEDVYNPSRYIDSTLAVHLARLRFAHCRYLYSRRPAKGATGEPLDKPVQVPMVLPMSTTGGNFASSLSAAKTTAHQRFESIMSIPTTIVPRISEQSTLYTEPEPIARLREVMRYLPCQFDVILGSVLTWHEVVSQIVTQHAEERNRVREELIRSIFDDEKSRKLPDQWDVLEAQLRAEGDAGELESFFLAVFQSIHASRYRFFQNLHRLKVMPMVSTDMGNSWLLAIVQNDLHDRICLAVALQILLGYYKALEAYYQEIIDIHPAQNTDYPPSWKNLSTANSDPSEKHRRNPADLARIKVAEQCLKRSYVLAVVLWQGRWRKACLHQTFVKSAYLAYFANNLVPIEYPVLLQSTMAVLAWSAEQGLRAMQEVERMAIFSQASLEAGEGMSDSDALAWKETAPQLLYRLESDVLLVQHQAVEARDVIDRYAIMEEEVMSERAHW